MAQLFHRGANNIAKASMVLVIILGGLVFFAYTQISRSSYLTNRYLEKQQPVQFSHKHHVGDDGIDCRYCHTSVETAASAGIPPTQTCMNCHNQLWADTPYLEPVRASYRDNEPILWERVHDLPGYAYFNHSIHVAKGVGCSTCHGQIDEMPAVYQENTLQMEWCLACHKNPEAFIRPKSEIYNMDWRDSDLTADERKSLGEEYRLRSRELLTSCSTCHR
ncbi:MAG: cytochrome C [Acidobacteria bacterium]|nr:MAG: cytochrome C [Acidobacteriota bacterium]REK04141.1 MAG: cytochrome C [Acidobacteriota bacterium]REK15303.1 MAG: cytochrome C [Acidobacteriota bacterium]REK46393.1 MAG: cytochrome C [Acidobacteriota bacterium]